MPVTVTSRYLATDEQAGSSDEQDRREYTVVFEVDQTDAGPAAAGVAVAIAAQQVSTGDRLPMHGDQYSFAGLTDEDSFAQKFSWKRPWPLDAPKRWHITVGFMPAKDGDSQNIGEPGPLLWATEYWIEWVEEQVPLETARVVESLDHVGRGANTEGPIINAAGEQTIDPHVKTVLYPILCCRKAYATLNEIIALNTTYQDTTNNTTYFGAAARMARYLSTESGQIQRAGGINYYLGVTRIWFKKVTWDRKVFNNGMVVLKKKNGAYIRFHEPNGYPKPFRHMIQALTYKTPITDPPEVDETQTTWEPSPEPANLDLTGQVLEKHLPAQNLTYRYLTELNYAGIGIGS